jgi:spoIIIJ-associated protein
MGGKDVDLPEAKEFIGETRAEAVGKASSYFGVGEDHLDLRVLPESLKIAGVGTRIVVLASMKDEPAPELGPVGQFANGMIQRMQLPGRSRVEETAHDDGILITLRGDALEEKVRYDARLPGAISHLIHRAAQRLVDQGVWVRVQVGERRQTEDGNEAEFERIAREGAEEAKRTGEPVLLRPMNSKERWVVHSVITGLEGVRSESVGEGQTKQVRIVPL